MSNLCQNLIDTVDNCEFNDVIIKLEDGEIFVNKFILSVRTNHFSSIFRADDNALLKKYIYVTVKTRKCIMKIIVEYIYGKRVQIAHLKFLEMIELLEMFRYFSLIEAFEYVEYFLKRKLLVKFYSLQECFDVIDIAVQKNFDKIKYYIIYNIVTSLHIINTYHRENIQCLPYASFEEILKFIEDIERKLTPKIITRVTQIKKLKFVGIWIERNRNIMSLERSIRLKNSFSLKSFTVKQLLGEVRVLKIFQLEEILRAVNRLIILKF